jgi:hypothetical protein
MLNIVYNINTFQKLSNNVLIMLSNRPKNSKQKDINILEFLTDKILLKLWEDLELLYH